MAGEVIFQLGLDLEETLKNEFASSFTIENLDSLKETFLGNYNKIGLAMDYETGGLASGNFVWGIFKISDLKNIFGTLPSKNWKVDLLDNSIPSVVVKSFVTKDVIVDDTLGIVKLVLGVVE